LQDREEIDGEEYTISEVTVHNWVRKHGTGRCKSSLSYYHLTKVVNSTTYQHHASYLRSTV
jgi:hypothetical protein